MIMDEVKKSIRKKNSINLPPRTDLIRGCPGPPGHMVLFSNVEALDDWAMVSACSGGPL